MLDNMKQYFVQWEIELFVFILMTTCVVVW